MARPKIRWEDDVKKDIQRLKKCVGDKIEKNEMGWACGAYGGGEGGV